MIYIREIFKSKQFQRCVFLLCDENIWIAAFVWIIVIEKKKMNMGGNPFVFKTSISGSLTFSVVCGVIENIIITYSYIYTKSDIL